MNKANTKDYMAAFYTDVNKVKDPIMNQVSINVTNHPGFLTQDEIDAGKFGVFLCDASPEDYNGDSEKRVGLFNSAWEAGNFAEMLHNAMPNTSTLVLL